MAMEAAKSSCMAQWEGGEGEGGEGEEQLEQEQEQDGEQGQYECPDPMSSPTLATVAISVSDAVAAATGAAGNEQSRAQPRISFLMKGIQGRGGKGRKKVDTAHTQNI